MKLIALGDLHGRSTWKTIAAKSDYGKIIFIGDYFDTHENISPQQQKENFKDVIAFKKEYPGRVVLLFGNHDFHYMRTAGERYSGFQPLYQADFQQLIHDALDEKLFQMCFVFEKILFVHAGLTKTWCAAHGIDMKNPEEPLNHLFSTQPEAFRFAMGKNSDLSGDDITQSPIWVRPKSLLQDKIDDYIQVVGHTRQKKITINDGIVLIDTLGTSGEYLKIEDGKISAVS